MFTVSQQSYKGTVVGTVQAIQQLKKNEDAVASAICSYQIQPLEAPFSIDRYGVIRVQDRLQGSHPYMFRVTAEDCRRPTPRKATVDVMVRQIEEGCQPGWKGVPAYLEYTGGLYTSGNLLRPYQLRLETCAGNCPDATIEARVELKSALKEYRLITASSDACLHDLEHLSLQRSLCDIYPATLTNLLPDPDKDIVVQLNRPPLGNPPRSIAPTQQWRFESSAGSVWEVDSLRLGDDAQVNAFDAEFTVTFWLVRQPGEIPPPDDTVEDREETVICSQDQDEVNWRFFSISFRDCHLIVRLMASFQYQMSHVDSEPRKKTVWVFGPLPEEYCRPRDLSRVTWHHYAITFSRSPWASTSEFISLQIDGQDLGILGVPIETLIPANPPYTPSERKARPRITVGACFDPTTRLTRQHLNGELAGLTVLLGKTESPNNLRCIAQCGESLLVPNVLKYLREDITVNLTNNAITVYGRNASHVSEVLRAIAYIRTQPHVSPDYVAAVAQARNLTLSTKYRCSPNEPVSIPPNDIQLYVPRLDPPSPHAVEVARPIMSGSEWVDKGNRLERPSSSQASLDRQASGTDKDGGRVTPPLSLFIQGSDIIITEFPINNFGIPIFSDIKFVLPDEPDNVPGNAVSGNAAKVILDSCHVWIASSGGTTGKKLAVSSNGNEGEHIEWSLAQVMGAGLAGKNDQHGVQLIGRKPAGDYEQVLRTLHYVPPNLDNFNAGGTQGSPNSDSEYVSTIGLMCSVDYGRQTLQFYVKIIIESSENAQVHLASNEAIERLSPNQQQLGAPHLAQSDQEKRMFDDALRPVLKDHPVVDMKQSRKLARPGPFMIAGIAIAVTLVIVLIFFLVAALIRGRQRFHQQRQPGRRHRFPAKPADFGGANLKQDPTLRLTANPVGVMEYTGLGTVSENLYGSYRNLAPNQYIFSPPTYRKCDSSDSGPRLADLDEFDEDYLDQADEQFCESEENRTTSDRSTPNGSFQNVEHQQDGVNDRKEELYRADEYGLEVQEWMDDGPERVPKLAARRANSAEVWDIVSHHPPSVNGPAPVDV
ncbi:hypothetical protein CRM22_002458 [Opisthorchis felineus]|uniref:Cadherin domain-containing protein n=1 Tax=Opisthorchis felineus TaxID=147828 RepID=A0A4S2MAB9_OPIFE|nr:hypothetical protein CRM22_002458 [Opisthorchis felineus]TGZ71750.1 hypothetical protein CRM22_002458 [Opisthorchis felineus]